MERVIININEKWEDFEIVEGMDIVEKHFRIEGWNKEDIDLQASDLYCLDTKGNKIRLYSDYENINFEIIDIYLYIEGILKNNKNILSAIINNNTYDIFIQYKWDVTSDIEKEIYRDIEIINVDDNFLWYEIQITYQNNLIHISVDNDDNITVY